MPRDLPNGLADFLASGRAGHTAAWCVIRLPDVIEGAFSYPFGKTFHLATADITIDGVAYEAALSNTGDITRSIDRQTERVSIDLLNLDDFYGELFLKDVRIIHGAEVRIGRWWREVSSGQEWSKQLFIGVVDGAGGNARTVSLSILNDLYAVDSIGGGRVVERECQVVFNSPAVRALGTGIGNFCGYTGGLTTCNKLLNHADGCSGRSNTHRYGGVDTLEGISELVGIQGRIPAPANQLIKDVTDYYEQQPIIEFTGAVTVSTDTPGGKTVVHIEGAGGGSPMTVKAIDGSPSVAAVSSLEMDEAVGFVVTTPAANRAQVSLEQSIKTDANTVFATTTAAIRDKGGQRFDVAAYGTLGTADDTAVFNLAKAAAVAAGGGVIRFPAGTFILANCSGATDCTIEGAGVESTILKRKNGTTGLFITSPGNRIHYRDFSIDGNYANCLTATEELQMGGGTDNVAENLRIYDWAGVGLTPGVRSRISNVEMIGAPAQSQYGIWCASDTGLYDYTVIENIVIRNTRQSGIYLGGQCITVVNPRLLNCHHEGNPGGSPVGGGQLAAGTSGSFAILGGFIGGATATSVTTGLITSGIEAGSGKWLIDGIEIAYQSLYGIYLQSGIGSPEYIIRNCKVHHCTSYGIGAAANVGDFSITGCRSYNNAYGIGVLAGTSDNYIIKDNDLRGNTTNFSDGGTGVNKQIAGNLPLGTNILGGTITIFGAADGGAPASVTLRAPAASGANIAGATVTFVASNGTGSGGSGSFIWQTAPAAAPSSTPNSMLSRMALTKDGRLGIGTTGPNAQLDVRSAANVTDFSADIRHNVIVYDTSTLAANIGAGILLGGTFTGSTPTAFAGIFGKKTTADDGDYSGYLEFATRNNGSVPAERMRIDNVGNIGMGTAGPLYPLDVVRNQDSETIANITNTSTGTSAYAAFRVSNSATVGNIGMGGTGFAPGGSTLFQSRLFLSADTLSNGILINAEGADPIVFGIGSLEIARFHTTGSLGIGTNSPSYIVHAKKDQNDGTQIAVENSTDGTSSQAVMIALSNASITEIRAHATSRTGTRYGVAIAGFCEVLARGGNGLLIGTFTDAKPIVLGTNGAERARIDSAGLVGIGTSAPTVRLTISDNAATLPAPPSSTNVHIGGVDGASSTRVLIDGFGAIPSLAFRAANNTAASPTALTSGQNIGQVSSFGRYDGSSYTTAVAVAMRFLAAEAWTNLAQGTHIAFLTTPIGDVVSNIAERMRITSVGDIAIGRTTASAKLDVQSATEQLRLRYDTSNYVSVTVNSSGVVTIAPSGGDVSITGALTVSTQITTPKVVWTGNVQDLAGTGSPESAVTAAIGSTYRRTDGGASTTLYVKESGTGNTGWTAYGAGGGGGGVPFADSTYFVVGSGDVTKRLRIELDGWPSGSTDHVWTAPNSDLTIAGINIAQTFTGDQTFSDDVSIAGILTTGSAGGPTTLTNVAGQIILSALVQASASTLIGRRSGSAGAYEVVTLGTGLSMDAAGVLSATGGGGGVDVTQIYAWENIHRWTIMDASDPDILSLRQDTSAGGQATQGAGIHFGLRSSTTDNQPAGRLYVDWIDGTHGTRKSEMVIKTVHNDSNYNTVALFSNATITLGAQTGSQTSAMNLHSSTVTVGPIAGGALTLKGTVTTGTDQTGGNWTFDAANGTGNAGSGSLIFRVGVAGSPGTTACTLTTAVTIANDLSVTMAGTAQAVRVGIGAAADGSKELTVSGAAPSFQLLDTTASAKDLLGKLDGDKFFLQELAGSDGSLLTLDLANTRIGIGTAAPDSPFVLQLQSGTPPSFSPGVPSRRLIGADATSVLDAYNSWAAASNFIGQRAGGTMASPAATEAASNIMAFAARGWDSSAGYSGGSKATILMQSVSAWTNLDNSTQIVFQTTPVGSTTIATDMTIKGGNIGVRTQTFGTSAVGVIGIANATAPTTSPADMIQIFSVDASAGNATLGLRTEAAVATESVTSDRTLQVVINGTVYKLMLKS